MIRFPGRLPPSALVRADPIVPAPLWLSASPTEVSLEDDRVMAWRARGAAAQALPVAANAAGTRWQAEPPALRFEAKVNGGQLLAGSVADLAALTIAVIFAGSEARTVLALQATGHGPSVFLDARGADHRLVVKNGAGIAVQALGNGARLVVLALASGRGWLSVDGGPAVSGDFGEGLAGPADLYIGCRGGRAGLRNKLGSFALSDVLIWPGQVLLPGPIPAGVLALWHERQRDGV
jgi:hypothetical protein